MRHVGTEADAGSIREVLENREHTSAGTLLHHAMLVSLCGAEAVRCAGLLLVITVCREERRLTARRERRSKEYFELGHAGHSATGAT